MKSGRRTWASARFRLMLVAACVAVLGIGLTAPVFSATVVGSSAAPVDPSRVPRPTKATPRPASPAPPPRPTAAATPTAATQAEATASPGPASGPEPGTPAQAISPALDAEINGIITANSDYEVGVALIGLPDGSVHQYGVEDPFEAASTAKVLAAAAYYRLVETGEASLDDPMGESTSGVQISEMIQNSDNDSWSMIMDAIGHEQLSAYASSIGITYDPEINDLTPSEMATILADLYSGKLLNSDDTTQLLSYMTDTNYESLIPAATPAGITVFHKYGLLESELHDAGILTKGTSTYAFVVYTRGADSDDIPERTDVIHQLTQVVVHALF